MDVKAKVQEWVDHQAAMFAAEQVGNSVEAQRQAAAAAGIEVELKQVGHDIRQLVCP